MPAYFSMSHVYLLWPIALVAILFGSAIAFGTGVMLNGFSRSALAGDQWLIATVFAFAGLTVGFLSGGSRESVMGQVIPASLSLIGILCAYLLAKDRTAVTSSVCAMTALTAGVLLGTFWGSEYRNQIRNSRAAIDAKAAFLQYCLLQEENVREYYRIVVSKEPSPENVSLKCTEQYRD